SNVPASRSPFATTVAKPPAASTARIRPVTSTCAGSLGSSVSAKGRVTRQAGKSDVRSHESARAAPDLLTFRVDQARFGNEDPAATADPAAFGHDLAGANRLGEVKVERRRQQEAVADQ